MRNNSLDFLKGFMALGILFIHTGTFIITSENFSEIESYLYSLSSLIVPIFFIISGYFFSIGRNKEKAVANIVTTYVFYVSLIVITNSILMNLNYDWTLISEFLITGGVNYFWFVNSLMYFVLIYFIFDRVENLNFDRLFWAIFLFLALNFVYLVNTQETHVWHKIFMDFTYFTAGFFIAKISRLNNVRIPSYFLFIVLVYPLCIGMVYNQSTAFTLFFSVFIFLIFKQIEMKENRLRLYSKYSLLILFIHYYIVNLFSKLEITEILGERYILIFLLVLIATLLIVHIISFVSDVFRQFILRINDTRSTLSRVILRSRK